MIDFPLRTIHKALPRLTQANLLRYAVGEAISVPVSQRPSTFNTVHMSSHEGEFFYELGKGVVDSRLIARVLLHYAASSVRVTSFGSLVDDFLEFHHAVSGNATIWRNLVSFVVGQSNDRAQRPEAMGRMPAEAIRERLGA